MPAILPVIATVVGIASSAVGLAEQLSGPSKPPSPPQLPVGGQTGAAGTLTPAQIAALVNPQASNIAELTSGFVSPGYTAEFAPMQAGVAGQPGTADWARRFIAELTGNANSAAQTFSPSEGPSNTALMSTQNPGFSDYLGKIAGAV